MGVNLNLGTLNRDGLLPQWTLMDVRGVRPYTSNHRPRSYNATHAATLWSLAELV